MERAKVTRIVHDAPQCYTIYETDFLHHGKWPSRHILDVNVHLGPAGFSMNLPLTPVESAKVEAREWSYFEALAEAVQDNPLRYSGVQIDTSSLPGREGPAG